MTTEVGTAAAVPTSVFSRRLRSTTFSILIIITLIAFEAMAVAAALPTAARDLHGLGSYGWAFTGFLVANVVGMVVSGQLSDTNGPRRPLVVGLICFAAGLLLAGTAGSMTQFVGGRVVQGLGSGLLITAIYVVIGETFAPSLQPKVFAATSSAWVLPALIGPLISGALTQHVSWRWVFLGLLPFVLIGAALLLPTLRRLPRAKSGSGSGLNDPRRIVRALAVAAGVALVQTAGQHRTPLWIAGGVAGVALLAWGLARLLPRGTATVRPGVSAPVALRGLLAGAFFGVDASIPLAMTVQHGYGATAAGLPLAAGGVTWAIGSWLQGRPSTRPEGAWRVLLLRSGFALVSGSALLVGVGQQPSAPPALVYVAWTIGGLGMGLAMSSTSVLLLRYTSDANRGGDSAALQLSDATGGALTTGFGGVLVGAAVAGSIGFTGAFWSLTIVMAVIAAFGCVVAGRAGDTGMTLGLIFWPYWPPERLPAFAAAADAAGLDELWVWEDCFAGGGIAAAAVALARTPRIEVGIGVLPVPLRNVALTAMEVSTLARQFPARLHVGVGHGVLDWMDQAGVRAASPMTLLREYVVALRALLAGSTVDASGTYVQLRDVTLNWPPDPAPPLYVGATRPKTLALAGELTDGVILTSSRSSADIAEARSVLGPDARITAFTYIGTDAAETVDSVVERRAAGADVVVLEPVEGNEPDSFLRFVLDEVHPRLG